ncbi:MAG: sodium:alanine symporter family protein [Oscillospiraceae bacterium]|nr:sodium:alanine symporter family protein [Oscillospiraceae bacterium]
MDFIVTINDAVNNFVWGVPAIAMILITGVFLTIKLDFLQFKHFGYLFKRTIVKAFTKKDPENKPKGEVTSFQAAMMSISAIVGSGNIAGVATAIIAGGPGAVFWMWIAALVGMATKTAEIALGIKYREERPDGTIDGGPMYYISKGMKCKWLGIFMSVCVIFYAIVISGIIDINTMAVVLDERFSIPAVGTGIFFAILTGICIFGGAKRVGKVCEYLAPFMGGAYIICGVAIVLLNIGQVPAALALIIKAAFTPQGVTGGAVGSMFIAMRYGFARGIFSNEAGVGSAAMVHCNTAVEHPMEQAVWGSIEVFLDTILVCTVSALAVILSGLWSGSDLDGARLVMAAFDQLLPGNWGGLIVTGAVVLFGFSCLITFNTYVERGATFIFGEKCRTFVRIIWVAFVFIGAISGESIVWDIADTVNGIIIFPNLIAIWFLTKELVAMKKEYTDPDIAAYKKAKKELSK